MDIYSRVGYSSRATNLEVDVSAFPVMAYEKHCGKSSSDWRDVRAKFKVICLPGAEGRYLRISKEGTNLDIVEVEIQVTTKGERTKYHSG